MNEIQAFNNIVRIYGTNGQVYKFNKFYLEYLDTSVINIKAFNTGAGTVSVEFCNTGNLQNILPVCIGTRVMFTENLWVAAGLINGTIGIIYNIG